MDADAVLRLINDRHGFGLELVQRYSTGEQGAYAVRDASGRRLVLKWMADEQKVQRYHGAARATSVLGGRGYPAPRYELMGAAWGLSYAVQEACPGAPLRALTMAVLPRLIELNNLQAGMASAAKLPPAGWPEPVIDPVLHGGDGFCLLETMRRYSPATANLLSVLQHVVDSYGDDILVSADVVHYDFNPLNILAAGDQISGVIDWKAVCAGDRAFDLATLLFYAYEDEVIRRALWSRLLQLATPRVAAVYLSHMIHRQVEWSVRHHSAAAVEHWLRLSRAVLDDLRGLLCGTLMDC